MKLKIWMMLLCMSMQIMAAEELTVVAVGEAELEREDIYINLNIVGGLGAKNAQMGREIFELLVRDFSFYRSLFSVSKSEAISINKRTGYLVNLKVTPSKRGVSFIDVGIECNDNQKNRIVFSEKQDVSEGNLRTFGHSVADSIYQIIAGKKSIFDSFLVFVSDIETRDRNFPIKELYRMDFDGFGKKRLTFHRGTVISPEISKDNRYVLYSLLKNEVTKDRRVNLYMLDLLTNKTSLISSRKGINSGAVFMPDGKHIALTLSHTDNAEIYALNLESGNLRKITNHFAIDVDPSISKDGTLMAFLSSRPGEAHIYTLDPRSVEKDVIRVSFVGKFNATPRFSPDGKKIAFASWLDERFDIFRIDANRKNLVRLTKDFGSNEDPTWSSDSQFIAFSSQRVITTSKAVHNIYIMTEEGNIIGPITNNFGMSISPRWSN